MLQSFSDGSQACRIDSTDKGFILYINKHWDYTSLLWGNYMKGIRLSGEFSDTIYLSCKSHRDDRYTK